jgi:rsbT co-antagonist protein RsbR
MSDSTEEIATIVVKHLVDILGGSCAITEEELQRYESDRAMAEILTGLLYLHQDLTLREAKRVRAEAELHDTVARLAEQNRELETSRAKLAALASELSTPVIRVWDGAIMLPLVGSIDTERGNEIMERLLSAVVADRASHAIIDITGVSMIDSATADQFIRIVRAIELLGGRAILAGVRPALAQALTALGVDLANITTVRSAEDALRLAMAQSRREPMSRLLP